jgi:kynurenine formamidase
VLELREGIVGRGVLLDVPRAEGVDALEPGRSVLPDDLEVAARAQGVEVGAGDIVLLRTGRWHPSIQGGGARATGDDPAHWERMAGWHATCMPWLHECGVAVIGCDSPQEARPPAYPDFAAPAHVVGLVAMGMPLIDNCDLEALSVACADIGRWEFQFVVTPLRIKGGTGSPVNPIAVL